MTEVNEIPPYLYAYLICPNRLSEFSTNVAADVAAPSGRSTVFTANHDLARPRSGHRHRPLHDFGYVALDIVGLIEEDNGVYTCRATNNQGVDETSAILRCSSECS